MKKNKFKARHFIASSIACLFLASCGKPSVEKILAEAKVLHQKGDSPAAIIQVKNVLQRDPDNGEARLFLGRLYMESGDSDSAEKEFRAAIRLKYSIKETLPLLGRSLMQQEEFKKVLEDTRSSNYGEAAQTAEVLAMRGHAQLSLTMDDEAEKSFADALQKQPDLPDALLGKARIALLQSDQKAALSFINKALVGAPKNADAWVMKGDLDRIAGRTQEAKEAYRKVVRLEPGNIAGNVNLASMQIAAGEFEEARKHVNILRQVAPDNPLGYYLSGVIDLRAGNYKNADAAAKDALKISPNYLPGAALAGAIAYASGSLDRAEEYLRTVVEKNPNSIYARKLLAATLIKEFKSDQALEILQPAIDMAPNDPSVLAIGAEANAQIGNFRKAIEYYEKVASIDPKSAEARVRLGTARFASGDVNHALVDLDSAAGLGGNTYQSNTLKALTNISRKQYSPAQQAVDALKKEQPDNPITYNLEAAIFGGQGKLNAARASLEKAISLKPDFFPATVNLAKLDLLEKNPQAARKRFEALLQKDPANLQALTTLADLGPQIGAKPEEITEWLEKARKGNPTALSPRLLLSRNYLQNEDYKRALEVAEEARKIAPNSTEPLEALGFAQLYGGDVINAVKTFSNLVGRLPKSPEARLMLAEAQLANQNPASAAVSLRKALELNPHFIPAQNLLAGIELKAGRSNDALQIANQIISNAPKSPIGYLIEGDVRLAEKKFPLAISAYEKAYALNKSGATVIKLYEALNAAEQKEKAEAKLLTWLKENPNDIPVRIYLASVSLQKEKYKLAIEQYEKALEVEPKNLFVLNNLAWAYYKSNDSRATVIAEKAYAINPTSPEIVDTYGWLLVNEGRVEKGLDLLDRASTLAPEHQQIRYHYAIALEKAGKKDAAIIELERILSSRTKFSEQEEAIALLKKLKN